VDHLLKLAPQNHYHFFYNSWRKHSLPEEWLNYKNISVHNFRIPNKIFRFLPLAVDQLIETDIVYSPHFDFLKIKHRPRVLTIHDLSFIHYPHFFSGRQRWWHWLQNVPQQIKEADHIVTNSQYTKQNIIETLKIPEEKITVIYPGIDLSLKIDSPEPQRSDNPFILYLGTIEPRKNINAIIKAFNLIKSLKQFLSLKLIIAGKPGWLYKNIIAEAKNSPYAQDIIFWGPVSQEEKIYLYHKAEVFVYPSFFEGFGFPPLEAQTCGCPVISSNRASLNEILGNSALKINPWRVDYLAEAILSVLTSSKIKSQLVKAGYENIKKYRWQQCSEQLLKLLAGCSSSLS
jgi:glycosyltransferase involved in cell wall biosynthesis